MEYLIGVIVGIAGVIVVMRLLAWSRDADRDPICGMKVRPDSPHEARFKRRRFRFCSDGCRRKFEEAPQRWLDQSRAPPDDGYS